MNKDSYGISEPNISRSHQSLEALLSMIMLVIGFGGAIAGFWIALKLMVNPDALIWVNQYLPETSHLAETNRKSLQTLDEIKATMAKSGYYPGYPLQMKIGPYEDVMLPIFAHRQGCQSEAPGSPQCGYIHQLRVYRRFIAPEPFERAKPTYKLITQLQVESPTEASVLAPLQLNTELSNRPLPLTTLKWSNGALVNTPSQRWIHLTGELTKEGHTIRYGQVVYYNPNTTHISSFLGWSSPDEQLPLWSKSGNSTQQILLTVNQTIGLEPRFKVYQLQPRTFLPAPVELIPIALQPFTVNLPGYQEGLKLAQGGLWTPALERLKPLSTSPQWSANAQGQLELIERHAQSSQSHANQSWASPSQEVLTRIIDGRWEEALTVYESPENQAEINQFLARDTGVLWHRIKTAIAVDPKNEGAIAWGALLRAAQDGSEGAIVWLEQQDVTLDLQEFSQLINHD